jgi:hypothetical protein
MAKKKNVNVKKENPICFICFQFHLNHKKPLCLGDLDQPCICNLPVHYECLQHWYEQSNTCPICHCIIYSEIEVEEVDDDIIYPFEPMHVQVHPIALHRHPLSLFIKLHQNKTIRYIFVFASLIIVGYLLIYCF